MLTLKEIQDFAQTYQQELAERQRAILEHYATALAEAFSEANLAAQQFLPASCDLASLLKPFGQENSMQKLASAGPAALASAFSGIIGKIAQAHIQLAQDIAQEASLPLSVLFKSEAEPASQAEPAQADAQLPGNIKAAPQMLSEPIEEPAPRPSAVQAASPVPAKQPAKRSKAAHSAPADPETAPAAKLAAKAKKPAAKTASAKVPARKSPAPKKPAAAPKTAEAAAKAKLAPPPSEGDAGNGAVGKAAE